MRLSQKIRDYIDRTPGHELILNRLCITDEEVVELVGILKKKPDITSISLQGNMIGYSGAVALFELPNLIKLDLAENQINDKIISGLTDLLNRVASKKSNLQTLNLDKNDLTDKTLEAILQLPRDSISIDIKNRKISDALLNEFYGIEISSADRSNTIKLTG